MKVVIDGSHIKAVTESKSVRLFGLKASKRNSDHTFHLAEMGFKSGFALEHGYDVDHF
jgi:hypothetical protein